MKGKVAVITGAGGEVGRAVAASFGRRGASLVLVDSNHQKLSSLVSSLGEGVKAVALPLDPTDPQAVRHGVKRVVEGLGGVDILVNSIDYRDGVGLDDSSVASWQRSLEQNLLPVITFSLEVIPLMKGRKYGRIVNVGNLEYLGRPGQSNYSTAKSAIFGLTRALALELARDGITVNQVLKGDLAGEPALGQEEEQKLTAQIPVQRLGKPEEVAHAVTYLAGEESGYVTGQNLIVCGGRSIHSSMSA